MSVTRLLPSFASGSADVASVRKEDRSAAEIRGLLLHEAMHDGRFEVGRIIGPYAVRRCRRLRRPSGL